MLTESNNSMKRRQKKLLLLFQKLQVLVEETEMCNLLGKFLYLTFYTFLFLKVFLTRHSSLDKV